MKRTEMADASLPVAAAAISLKVDKNPLSLRD